MEGKYELPGNTYFWQEIASLIGDDGLFNAHLHLCRAGTFHKKYFNHVGIDPLQLSTEPLVVKQNAVGYLHSGHAYREGGDYRERLVRNIEELIRLGVRRADTFIDATADGIGTRVLEITLEEKDRFKDLIDLRVAANGHFGFKESEPERWEVFDRGAHLADYIGCLPERDERASHIGRDEHFRKTLDLALKLGKPIHYHTDQKNDPSENITEDLVQAVRWKMGPPSKDDYVNGMPPGPQVWAVHAISPSAYDEERFQRLASDMATYNIGLITCPTAAVGMRQDRSIQSPTHSSIARVLDFLAAGVYVRVGSDNVDDVFIPNGTFNVLAEIDKLLDTQREYTPGIAATLAKGERLNEVQLERLKKHLHDNK